MSFRIWKSFEMHPEVYFEVAGVFYGCAQIIGGVLIILTVAKYL